MTAGISPDVLDKIKKLLSLGKSDNVHEAALAIARAQQLMERHRITQAMLELSGEAQSESPEADPTPFYDDKNMSPWRIRLALVICRANGCVVYTSRVNGKKTLMIIGTPGNVGRARYLFLYCLNEIKRLTKQELGSQTGVYERNFKLGCIDAIESAIQKEQESLRETMRKEAANPNALVLVTNAIAKVSNDLRAAQDLGYSKLNLRKGRASGHRGYDGSAREHGRQAGANIYPGNKSGSITGGAKRLGPGS